MRYKKTEWEVFDRQMEPTSETLEIEEAFRSLRRHYGDLLANAHRKLINLPVDPGDRLIVIRQKEVLKILWEGEIKIDKVYKDNEVYRIVNPIIFNAALGIKYTPEYTQFGMYPEYGFHITSNGLCLGDMRIENGRDAQYYKGIIPQFLELWSGINTKSLGDIVLPPSVSGESAQVWATIKNGIDTLLEKGFIEAIKIN